MRKRPVSKFAVVSLMATAFVILCSHPVLACQRGTPFKFDELFVADVIVVATAERYAGEPDLSMRTTGVPKVQVEFTINETLKGNTIASSMRLSGYLGEKDDFNELAVPYTFVRRNGRSGSCFANTYKTGAKFLLFMRKTDAGYTTNISALGPTNEQLRGNDDPWLLWVRNALVN